MKPHVAYTSHPKTGAEIDHLIEQGVLQAVVNPSQFTPVVLLIKPNDPVPIQNNATGPQWMPTTVLEAMELVSYKTKTPDGQVLCRHGDLIWGQVPDDAPSPNPEDFKVHQFLGIHQLFLYTLQILQLLKWFRKTQVSSEMIPTPEIRSFKKSLSNPCTLRIILSKWEVLDLGMTLGLDLHSH